MPVSKLRALSNLISDTVTTIEQLCASKNVTLPDLDAPFSLQSEGPLMDLEIAGLALNVVAASAQLSAMLKPAPMGALLIAMQVCLSCICLYNSILRNYLPVSRLISAQGCR